MKKVLAFDVDGTISFESNLIYENLKHLLIDQINAGTVVVLATGRSSKDLQSFLEINKFYVPAIVLNGGAIYENGKLRNCSRMNKKSVIETMKIFNQYEVPFLAYTESLNISFRTKSDTFIDAMKYNMPNSDLTYFEESITPVDNVVVDYSSIIKLEAAFRNLDLIPVIRDSLSLVEGINVASSMPHNIEICSKNVSKGSKLKEYIYEQNLSEGNVYVFGDSENDISMFDMFGNSVYVDNGNHKEFKTKYRVIANKGKGVYDFLHKLLS